jgi:hypothetical protein
MGRSFLKERAFYLSSPNIEAIMRFIYRGVRYEATPATLEVREGAVTGKYRGADWRSHELVAALPAQPMHHLKYRGVPYTTGETVETGEVVLQPQTTIGGRSRVLPGMARVQLDRLHKANIERNIVHRLEVAKAHHDNALVALLERELTLCR